MRGKSNVITKLRKRNVEKVWGARYTLGARYLSKNMVITMCIAHTSEKPVDLKYESVVCLLY